MFRWIEKHKVSLTVSVFWKVPSILLSAISRFQATEADGVWHLLRATKLTQDPKLKAALFTHMIEEESHADAFSKLYQQLGNQAFNRSNYERKELFHSKTPLWKILTFVHVGEEDATERFRTIHGNLKPGPLKTALKKIIEDEDGHVGLTEKLAKTLGASPKNIRLEVRRVRFVRAWEGWIRSGRRIADLFMTLVLSGVYFLVGVLLAPSARRKLSERFVSYDNNKIKSAKPLVLAPEAT